MSYHEPDALTAAGDVLLNIVAANRAFEDDELAESAVTMYGPELARDHDATDVLAAAVRLMVAMTERITEISQQDWDEVVVDIRKRLHADSHPEA